MNIHWTAPHNLPAHSNKSHILSDIVLLYFAGGIVKVRPGFFDFKRNHYFILNPLPQRVSPTYWSYPVGWKFHEEIHCENPTLMSRKYCIERGLGLNSSCFAEFGNNCCLVYSDEFGTIYFSTKEKNL